MALSIGALHPQANADEPSAAHLQRIIEAQPGCLSRVSSDGRFLAVNDAALALLGAERRDQVLDTSFLDLVDPESRENCRAFLSRTAAGERGSLEIGLTGLGGLTRILQVHAIAHPASSDSISSALCTFRDITEHRQVEQALVNAVANKQQLEAASYAAAEEARADLERRLADAERQLGSAQQQFDADLAAHGARVAALEEAVRAGEDPRARVD